MDDNNKIKDADHENIAANTLLNDDDTSLTPANRHVSDVIRNCPAEELVQASHGQGGGGGGGRWCWGKWWRQKNEEDELDGNGLQDIFLDAKSMLELTEYREKKHAHGPTDYNLWKVMKVVNIAEERLDDLKQKDSSAHDKLVRANLNRGKYCLCCQPCYNDPDTPLTSCLVKPSFKNGIIDGTGNITKHLKATHEELWHEARNDLSFSYVAPMSASVSEIVDQSQAASIDPQLNKPSPPKQVKVDSMLYSAAQSTGDKTSSCEQVPQLLAWICNKQWHPWTHIDQPPGLSPV
jgi:hypothetical protein